MASHAPQSILFVTNEGSVMSSGYSGKLAKGQFGIVDKGATPTAAGLAVVNSLPTTPKDRLFELRLGIAPLTPTRSQSNKAYSSLPFKLSEVVDIRVSAPDLKVSVDKFLIGYDGINADTALTFANGDNEVIDITLSGDAIGMLGYPQSKVTVKLYLEKANTGTITNQEIVEKGVERLKNITLVGGVPITTYIKVTPVNSSNAATPAGATAANFWTLTVKDAGNQSALALVKAAYPTLDIVRESYIPGTGVSVYKTVKATTPSAFSQVTSIQDSDCAGSLDCTDTTVSTAWVAGDSCNTITETYEITLPDDGCGNTLTAQLSAFYPDLTISTKKEDSVNSSKTVTLTGTSGTANIAVAGTNYLATFATSLTQTATNFVTTHAAALLADKGVTVTSSGAVLTFVHATTAFPTITITNATGDLAGTLGTVTVVLQDVAGACSTVYTTSVISDIVCEDCSPELRDLFITEAPAPYGQSHWTKAAKTYDADALMGIHIESKVNILAGTEEYRDDIPAIYDFTRISIANQAPGYVNESFKVGSNGRFAVKLLQIGSRPSGLGMDLQDLEERTRVYFENRQRLHGNNYGKLVLGQESLLKPTVQYVVYTVRVRTNRFAQSFSGELVENVEYHIAVDACKYSAVETLVNAIATAAGLDEVAAY